MELKSDMIRARMEPGIKRAAEAVFRELGLSTTDAIALFYRRVILERGLPFDLRLPNEETQKALRETRRRKGLKRTTLDALKREFDRPDA